AGGLARRARPGDRGEVKRTERTEKTERVLVEPLRLLRPLRPLRPLRLLRPPLRPHAVPDDEPRRNRRDGSCGAAKSSSPGGRMRRSNARNSDLENGKNRKGKTTIRITVVI